MAIKFIGTCNRIRQTNKGERFWQNAMRNKKRISEKEFLRNSRVKDILDEGESWAEYKYTCSRQGDPVKFFRYYNYYFFQTAGFEFFWRAI